MHSPTAEPAQTNPQRTQDEFLRSADIAAQAPTFAEQTTNEAFARAAMHEEVAREAVRLEMLATDNAEGSSRLASGLLKMLTDKSPKTSDTHEPTLEQRPVGRLVEVTPEQHRANIERIAKISDYLFQIHAIALRNGQASFAPPTKEDYDLGA